jgi:hypothetical protein
VETVSPAYRCNLLQHSCCQHHQFGHDLDEPITHPSHHRILVRRFFPRLDRAVSPQIFVNGGDTRVVGLYVFPRRGTPRVHPAHRGRDFKELGIDSKELV